jgi:hypothetical protein
VTLDRGVQGMRTLQGRQELERGAAWRLLHALHPAAGNGLGSQGRNQASLVGRTERGAPKSPASKRILERASHYDSRMPSGPESLG